ncbi:MAG: hypothetical protein V4670_06055 [Bacteroidota bacterium]
MKLFLHKSILLVAIFFGLSISAQVPQKMSYQSVIRNAGGVLAANSTVGIRISILQGSASGTEVYIENHSVNTNANGLASLEIGGGTFELGNFASINWANGPYFVKTEVDPAGGVNYTISGTSQLLSVPYALHAKTAEKIVNPVFVAQTGIGNSTTIRNTPVFDDTVITVVPETGKYLIIVDATSTNPNRYSGLIAGDAYDSDCWAIVYKNGVVINIAGITSKKAEYFSSGLQNVYYLNSPQSMSGIVDLVQGDALTVGYRLDSFHATPPNAPWYYFTNKFTILKVGD